MASFIINGGNPLRGSVRLGGAKNVSFKLMIASLLCDTESRILNIPDVADVHITREIMEALGARLFDCGERIFCIQPQGLKTWQIPERLGTISRASSMFVGPLLTRFGQVDFPLPGGDKIGNRPLERHFEGLKALGAKVTQTDNAIHVTCAKLRGAHYRFPKNSHTGTESLIMSAVKASGRTIIENAAQEPEVDDLISFLVKCGAKIRRSETRTIEIDGVSHLEGSIHRVMPDQNEAVSYACAALGTQGDVIIENARASDLKAFLDKVREAEGFYEVADYGIRVWFQNKLKATKVATSPHPGFKTDWQPLWTTLMTQAQGVSEVVETVYENRFGFTTELSKMGANITPFDPKPKDPDKFYNFNLADDQPEFVHGIQISGPSKFNPVNTTVKDIRFGATLVLAALMSQGQSHLTDVQLIDRGYEQFDVRLRQLGADITREE